MTKKEATYYFAYIGAKTDLIPRLELLLPDSNHTFFEACGGSGVLSLNWSSRFKKTIYNEIDPHVVRLFKLMQDTKARGVLIKELPQIEWDEKYFDMCRKNYKDNFSKVTDDIEKAKQTFALAVQSRYNAMTDWGNKKRLNEENLEARLKDVASALERVEITNRDCFELIDSESKKSSSFIYLDPPYVNENRYENVWTYEQHARFAELCLKARCKIMISSRSNGIYDEIFEHHSNPEKWGKIYVGTKNSSQNYQKDTVGVLIDGKNFIEKAKENDEYVYINYYPEKDIEKNGFHYIAFHETKLIRHVLRSELEDKSQYIETVWCPSKKDKKGKK